MGPLFALAAFLMTPQQITDQSERDAAIAKAVTATRAAMPVAEADPNRPVFHFHPPAQWMNDPNGPFFSNGWYHLFYQFGPYSDRGGRVHWGHARSRDLVNWEELPPALWPSIAEGEDGCWSGSTFFDDHGKPVIYYTSVGPNRSSQQWAAMPDDDDFIKWHKDPANPRLEQGVHGMPAINEWRDPFLFQEAGQTYLITGGGQSGRGAVFVYRSTNPELTAWSYVGVLFHHPDSDVANIECPNFGRIGDHWVLLTSVHGRVEAFVGKLDDKTMTLQVEHRSVLNAGSYASQLLPDPHGRLIHFAWMPMDKNKGWNGCMTLPSVLTLANDGTLIRQPVPELKRLRGKSHTFTKQELHTDPVDNNTTGLVLTYDKVDMISVAGDVCEIEAEFDTGTSSTVSITIHAPADGPHNLTISYDPSTRMLSVPGREPVIIPPSPTLKLHIFLDRSILDVYANDGVVSECAQILQGPKDLGHHATIVSAFVKGGKAILKHLTIWQIKPANFDTSLFK